MNLDSLMLELKNGDRRALVEIYNQTKRAVFSVSYGVLRNSSTAEDIMQETYIKVCANISSYQAGTKPLAWICQIARNIAIDEYRKRKKLVSFDEKISNSLVVDDEKEIKADADYVLKIAKEILNETEYQVVYMHTIGDIQHKEIARILRKPYATIRWNYAQAIKKLKLKLENYEVYNEEK